MKTDRWKSQIGKLLPSIFLLALGIFFSNTKGLERWDRFIYDFLTNSSTRPPAEDIIIIAIDEHSLAHYGRWPWSRRIHAELIDKLSIGGAKAIGFDIVIAEPNPQESQNDQLLAEALARSERVFMPVLSEPDPTTGRLQLTMPITGVREAVAGLGHVHFGLDSDGMLRRTFLKGGLGTPDYESMALAMLTFTTPSILENLPGRRNPDLSSASPHNWVRDYEILLPFAGPPGHFQQISYRTFMDPDFSPAVVADRYVFVGTTAIGLGDSLPTPVSGDSVPMPGVEINANLLDSLASQLAIQPMQAGYRVTLTVLLILIPLLLYPLVTQRVAQVMLATSLVLILLLCKVLLSENQIWYPPGSALLVLIISYPLWAWRRLEKLVRRLFKEKEQALVTLHSIGDGVITTDNIGRIRYMNPVAEEITGYSIEEAQDLLLRKVLPLTDEDQGGDLTSVVQDCLDRMEILHLEEEALFVDRTGKEHAARISAGPLKDQQGKSLGTVLGISDVTEKRHALRELSYRSTHDLLTGLPNRLLLSDRLSQAITRAQSSGSSVAVLYLNLDNFKKVNDQVGHDGGDELLQLVSKRLEKTCREGDTAARLGGDEFIVLLEELPDEKLAATRAEEIIQIVKLPFEVNSQELFLSGTIGISVFPKDGNNVEMLMKNGDIAMYEAKKKRTGGYLFFSAEMNELIQQRLQLEVQLRNGLTSNEFELYYQPQVRLSDNRIVGVEALVRWNPGDENSIPPSSFIPMAEESGLILPLSEWILLTACNQAKIWQDELKEPICVSINISPKHFLEDDLPLQLKRIIERTGVDPRYLDLEITEGSIMENVARSAKILGDFKTLGGTVSIDDFGTGYSSLAYLKQFPFDKLKIDKSFVDEIDKDEKDKGLAQTIIAMGHGLGLAVVAEGVDSVEQLAVLQAQGCDIIQGYYFSHPLPAAELTALLKKSPTLHPYTSN